MGVHWILMKNNANSPRKNQMKDCGLACWKLRFESYWNIVGGLKQAVYAGKRSNVLQLKE